MQHREVFGRYVSASVYIKWAKPFARGFGLSLREYRLLYGSFPGL